MPSRLERSPSVLALWVHPGSRGPQPGAASLSGQVSWQHHSKTCSPGRLFLKVREQRPLQNWSLVIRPADAGSKNKP